MSFGSGFVAGLNDLADLERVLRPESLMCKAHPGLEWPHRTEVYAPGERREVDCPGPGVAWRIEGRAAIEALIKDYSF